MNDHRADSVGRTTIRGKLLRSGRVWPCPIDDTRHSYWSVCDDLFSGDRIVFPDTKMHKAVRLSVVCKSKPRLHSRFVFSASMSCQSSNYWLYVQATCEKCGKQGPLDITVDEVDEEASFSRHCPCGHSFRQDTTYINDW